MSNSLSRRQFLRRTALGAAGLGALGAAGASEAGSAATPERKHIGVGAANHPLVRDGACANFLEGAILGNGNLGAVVTSLPDTVMIYIGHNAVWDQRTVPLDLAKLGTFEETLRRIKAIPAGLKNITDDPWFAAYQSLGKAGYKQSYPRPVPCGAIALGFDRREAEVIGHRVLIERGLCQVDFLVKGKPHVLEIFVDADADRVWARMLDHAGAAAPAPFVYLGVVPDGANTEGFPRATHGVEAEKGALFYRQVLPFETAANPAKAQPHPQDRAFALAAQVAGRMDTAGAVARGVKVGARLEPAAAFGLLVELHQGLANKVDPAPAGALAPSETNFSAAAGRTTKAWGDYWQKSAVSLADPLLEESWYWNAYFLRCALSAGTVSPGLYAICPAPNQATVWHGDYHFDYNIQQAYWSTLSSNHAELNLPYVAMIENLMPICRQWASDYYHLRGAYFPISAYPVPMRTYPYAAPIFNWMVGISAWAIQGLWWHYRYTMDLAFLRDRAFEPIKAVVLFLADYIRRPDVAAEPWGDSYCHIFPTFPPEMYGLRPGLPKDFNADTIVDLTLTRFAFQAYVQACRALGRETEEAADLRLVEDLLQRLPPYPTANSSRGRVMISVRGEETEKVYNVPLTLMPVFPGEHYGLHSPAEEFALAANTYRNQQNEGGNDLVFLNLQGARLGLLDLEKFKREIRYARVANGTCTDKNLQVGGRFGFGARQYDWMQSYGIWFENLSLPAVINECLVQGYNGEVRLFPNWPKEQAARFDSLRVAGAFLVSAECGGGQVQWVEILSEAGGDLTMIAPWPTGAVCERASGRSVESSRRFTLPTHQGEKIRLTKPGKV